MTALIFLYRFRILLLSLVSGFPFLDAQLSDYNKYSCRAEYRRNSAQPCLDNLVRLVNSDNAFWFGTNLEAHCNASSIADVNSPNCYLSDTGPRKYSIAARLFTVPPNIQRFQKYLTVSYVSPPDNYTACGADFVMPRKGIDANPDMPPVEPWFVRNPPTFSLRAEAGSSYTILVIDGAYGNILGAVVNHPNEDRFVVPYRPPYNARNVTTPIVFVAYKQNSASMQIQQKWINIMTQTNSGTNFDLSSFALDHQLNELTTMNIMLVRKDPWSAQQLQKSGQNFCAQFIAEALKKMDEQFMDDISTDTMDSFLALKFTAPASSFSICCTNYSAGITTVFANPLSDKTTDAIFIRDPPGISVNRANANTVSAGGSPRLYTVVAVDPTIPKNALATPDRPYGQWIVMNVEETQMDRIADKGTVLPYAPTIPAPQSPAHQILYFLFEQPNRIEDTSRIAAKYSDPLCADFMAGRCLFQFGNFTSDFKLILRAASWITVVADAYSRYWLVKSGQFEGDICNGQPNYQRSCSNPGDAFVQIIPSWNSAGNSIMSKLFVAGAALFLFALF